MHPSKLQPLLAVSLVTTTCTVLGLFIWAVASNHGSSALPPEKTISSSERSFRILQAMSAVAGSWTGVCIRQSDWTRFAKTRRAPALHQVISGPVTVTVCAILGAFATSAIKNMYGEAIWNPISVLQFLLDRDYNAATRAGCFFAGLGFFISQVSVLMGRHWTRKGANQHKVVTNLVQNSISCGMDLAALSPRWVCLWTRTVRCHDVLTVALEDRCHSRRASNVRGRLRDQPLAIRQRTRHIHHRSELFRDVRVAVSGHQRCRLLAGQAAALVGTRLLHWQ